MARKKQEIALQREIETQEEWEEVMAMEGLWVVDVYQEWCGPCLALVGNFRRLKNELGDSLLNFAMAKADTIDALEKYRGRCEPTFLFFAGGILTSYIHGANAPKVQRIITEQLASEHKILEGQGERKEVKDPVITRMQEIESERLAEEEARQAAEGADPSLSDSGEADSVSAKTDEESQIENFEDIIEDNTENATKEAKGVTVAIIKPDAVAQGKADEIINEMKEQGIEVVAEEQRELTDEEARQLYSELQDESYFEELIRFITSGPSHLLVITRGQTGETIAKDWRELIGPANVEEAKEEAPNSFRAKYGEKGYMNAVHGSSSKNMAAKELAFFFPNLQLPTYLRKKENIQRTLALIRPEAFANKKDEILAKIHEAGFKIAMYKELQLTKEQAADFYKEHEQYAYFDSLVETMSSGPILALGLARDEAIQAWRDVLGPANVDEAQEKAPNSLRAKFAGTSGINALHGSDTAESAKKEISYFFPMEQTIGVIKPNAMSTKDEIIEKIHQAGFRIAAQQETTITPEVVDILYPEQQEAEYYEDLVNSMTSGPTLFMVLSREDAVNGWRREIGTTDPEQAREKDPLSLRAEFGIDILDNAVHGSSNTQRAQEEMRVIFGDLKFNADGTVRGDQPELDETAVVIEKERADDIADVAPEYRTTEETTAGETTAGETTADQDTTQNATMEETQQDLTADTTQDVTADTTQMETTAGDTTQSDTTQLDTAQGDTTEAEASQRESTIPETSEGDTTQAETAAGDTTQTDETANDASAEPSSADPGTTADQTTADQTTADQTTTDQTTEPKSEPEAQEAGQETIEPTPEEPAPKEEDTQEAPADKPPSPSASPSQQQQQQQQQEQEAAGDADKAEGQEATTTAASPSSPSAAAAATPTQDGKGSSDKDAGSQKKKDEGETAEGETPAEGGETTAGEGEATSEG